MRKKRKYIYYIFKNIYIITIDGLKKKNMLKKKTYSIKCKKEIKIYITINILNRKNFVKNVQKI